MDAAEVVAAGERAIQSLAPAVAGLEHDAPELADVRRAAERGHLTPAEDLRLQLWFARYLTARDGLVTGEAAAAELASTLENRNLDEAAP